VKGRLKVSNKKLSTKRASTAYTHRFGGPLKSKIFLSCGQRAKEHRVASQIERMLTRRGFEVYVAKDVQSIPEINSGIIRELKDSDCYLFVNFCREELEKGEYRGSLFSHQEFAVAYALGFDNKILVVNQKGAKREGLLKYFGCNTEQFSGYDDCFAVVQRALKRTKWRSDYSRRLQAGRTHVSRKIRYTNRETEINLKGDMWYLDIHNHRPDIAARETTGRLISYKRTGSRVKIRPEFQSPLKATGKPAFSHTIFPRSHEDFDLLCIGESIYHSGEERVYLNSALDLTPTPSLKITNGTWELIYEFHAIEFPVLRVVIELRWPKRGRSWARVLAQEFP
jgi:hypothetical protein